MTYPWVENYSIHHVGGGGSTAASRSAAAKWSSCLACLIIRLIIQTILLDPSGAIETDEPSNVSRPDPSGADQIDAEHQATDLAVRSALAARMQTSPARTAPTAGAWGSYYQ
jgi:hypothetical protein